MKSTLAKDIDRYIFFCNPEALCDVLLNFNDTLF